jgi:hypothetical protein
MRRTSPPRLRRALVRALAAVVLVGFTLPAQLAGQAGATSACFEIREVGPDVPGLPDSLQVVVHGTRGSGPGGAVLPHVALGSFTDVGLVVFLRSGSEDPRMLHLVFRPRGDRMVGWLLEDGGAVPPDDSDWAVEAHRFECPSGPA